MKKTIDLQRRLASRHIFFVQFTKRDGSARSMRLRYEGGRIVHQGGRTAMYVRDLDKDAIRIVTLDTISVLTEAKPPRLSDIKKLTDQLF